MWSFLMFENELKKQDLYIFLVELFHIFKIMENNITVKKKNTLFLFCYGLMKYIS